MNQKKIVIPAGMTAAFEIGFAPTHTVNSRLNLNAGIRGLETALLWLSENPIVPTEEQFSKLYDDLDRVSDGRLTFRAVIEWQRRMLIAENPAVLAVKNMLAGYTLTTEEADELASYVKSCAHARMKR